MNKKYIHPVNKRTFLIWALAGIVFYVIPLGFDYVQNRWYNPFEMLFDFNYLTYVFNTSLSNYWLNTLNLLNPVSPSLASVFATVLVPSLGVVSVILYYKENGKTAVNLQIIFLIITVITLVVSMFKGRDDIYYSYYRPTIFALILPALIIMTIIAGNRGIRTATENKPIVAKKVEVIKENASSADELKKYKELYDMGVITEEEFAEKKKQLLEL